MNCLLAPNPISHICPSTMPAQERYLSAFIQSVLQKARANQEPTEVILQLLDCAWEAQKLLWKLRIQQIQNDCCFD